MSLVAAVSSAGLYALQNVSVIGPVVDEELVVTVVTDVEVVVETDVAVEIEVVVEVDVVVETEVVVEVGRGRVT
jgi:hypothetical protein